MKNFKALLALFIGSLCKEPFRRKRWRLILVLTVTCWVNRIETITLAILTLFIDIYTIHTPFILHPYTIHAPQLYHTNPSPTSIYEGNWFIPNFDLSLFLLSKASRFRVQPLQLKFNRNCCCCVVVIVVVQFATNSIYYKLKSGHFNGERSIGRRHGIIWKTPFYCPS